VRRNFPVLGAPVNGRDFPSIHTHESVLRNVQRYREERQDRTDSLYAEENKPADLLPAEQYEQVDAEQWISVGEA
jgi:hypothetical protein